MEQRNRNFQRNSNLEALLKEINGNLDIAEKDLLKTSYKTYPVILLMGAARSGSTLTTQWFANTGEFAYPTNVMSRFYQAPIIGAKVQKLLFDPAYNFRNEIIESSSSQAIDYISENGKTKGALAPNEFWYFWRRFLNYEDETMEYIPDDELEKTFDKNTFINELMGMANVFQKPIMLKGLIMNYNIEFLNKIIPQVLFIYIKRNPYDNIASILEARKRQLGDERKWWSFKIPEILELKKMENPILQVAGQVYYINKAIEQSLEKIPDERKCEIPYEDFCDNPEKYYYLIREKLVRQGYVISNEYIGKEKFATTRKERRTEIIEAYDCFVKDRLSVRK